MSHSRKFIRVSLAVAMASGCAGIFAACGGDSKSADNAPGNGAAGNGATGSLRPGAPGATNGTTEGPPTVVGLDPNRDTSTPVNLGATGAVACGGGGNFCVAPNPTCCAVGVAGAGMNDDNNTFSCAASTADCPPNTVASASCSSQLSCSSGQVCCRVDDEGGGDGTTATCAASCVTGATQLCLDDAECTNGNVCNNNDVCAPPPCTADSCGVGELCCRGGGGGGGQPACVAPAADGLCPNGRRQVCTDAATCPAENTCSRLGGNGNGNNALVCTPPPCTPTSCAAGQVCCVGGGINTPTCAAASATGACDGNSRLVCITDAECAAAPNTACLLGNNGQGSLSCRTPPPPPVPDAGAVGDAG